MTPDPLFKGARRGPTIIGIPMPLAYGAIGGGVAAASLIAIPLGPIAFAIVAAVVAPVLIALRLVATDAHAFRLLGLRILMRVLRRARTIRFWRRASAYAPVRLGRPS